MSFACPPLPGETLLTVKQAAERIGCSREAIYTWISDRRIGAVTVAGRYLIAESEVERFIREWPVRPNGQAAANRWADYRRWKAAQRQLQTKAA